MENSYDWLLCLSASFPEVKILVKNGLLPYTLAESPLVLVSWLVLSRRIGLDLKRWPSLLPEIVESLGSDFYIVTFLDDGPPVVRNSLTLPPSPCGECDGCWDDLDCESLLPGKPEFDDGVIRVRFLVRSDFDVTSVSLEDNEIRLLPKCSAVLEHPDSTIPRPLRYLPQVHGQVKVVQIDSQEEGSNSDLEESLDKETVLSAGNHSRYLVMEALDKLSTLYSSIPSIFSAEMNVLRESKSDVTATFSDNTSDGSAVAWKRRLAR